MGYVKSGFGKLSRSSDILIKICLPTLVIDHSDAANQSQVEVFGSEEDNSSLASSLKSTSLDQPSYKENSSKEDQFDQEMVSNSG